MKLARLVVRALGYLTGDRPIPIGVMTTVRRLSTGADALFPQRIRPADASRLGNAGLAEMLRGVKLGDWSLAIDTIDLLERLVRTNAPTVVLEFGSGISTVCLAQFLRELPPVAERRLVSLEQSNEAADVTRQLLERCGLASHVTIFVAPLESIDVDGRRVSSYSAPVDEVREACGRPADLVLIDGPAAEDGARYSTLVRYGALIATGATVILDDALRDGELDSARRWRDEGYVDSEGGVILMQKGLFFARFVGGVRRVPSKFPCDS